MLVKVVFLMKTFVNVVFYKIVSIKLVFLMLNFVMVVLKKNLRWYFLAKLSLRILMIILLVKVVLMLSFVNVEFFPNSFLLRWYFLC